MSRRLVYICSPLRGDYEANAENARTYCRVVMRYGPADVIPLAPHIYFPQFLDDTDDEERRIGMAAGIALLDRCEELWAFGLDNPSEGMSAEIEHAKERGIPVRDGFEVLADYIQAKPKGGVKCKQTADTEDSKASALESTSRTR